MSNSVDSDDDIEIQVLKYDKHMFAQINQDYIAGTKKINI